MNEVNETLREINNSISYYNLKKIACEEAINELKKVRQEIMDKYNIPYTIEKGGV